MQAPLPPNEPQRLDVLHAFGILDSDPEESFADIVRLASHLCAVPISAVSLVDAGRQWFKALCGLEARETSRDLAFCAHAILDPTQPLIVPDATLDPRFADNPLVTGAPHIRFYAGAPLVTRDGFALGSLCVIDTVPRHLTAVQIDALTTLARQVMRQIESRQGVVELVQQKAALDHHSLVVIADAAGRITYVNDRFCALSQHPRPRLLSSDAGALRAGHPARPFFSPAWATLTAGAVWRGEVQGETASGQPYWLQTTVVPMRHANGKPWQYVALGTDITERKRTEEKLRRSERWSRELIEALPAAVYTTDTEGRITMFNRAAVEFSGRVPRLGSDSWCVSSKLFQPDGTPLAHDQSSMAQSLHQGRALRDQEAIAERPDGRRIHFIPHPTPLRDESGALLGGVNMLVDITERKRQEDSLRLLSSALQQAQESILITDARLDRPGPQIVFVNAAFSAMTGYSSEEAVGRTPRMSQGPRTDRAVVKRLRETLAAGGTFQGETVNYRKDGTAYDLEWQVAPMRNARGVTTHFVAVQRDISTRKAAERELARAREAALESARLKTCFMANMSHELRTPLNTINGLSAMLTEQAGLPDSTKNAARLILQCGETLLANIQTILTHSSLEAGKTTLDAKPFALASLVLNAVRITGEAAQRKHLDLDYDLDPATPAELVGDPFRLQQVLVNLLANAIKFTDRGRVCLRLRTHALGGDWALRFTVADTGIGIARENLDKLFKPFSQADDSSTRRFEGTGLGLAITKSLVELMGGEITVRSQPGRGSLFRFTVVLPGVPDSPRVFESVALPDLAGKRLLIVEPDRLRARLLHAMALAWQLQPTLAAAPAGAVTESCDIVVRGWPAPTPATPRFTGGGAPVADAASPPTIWLSTTGAPTPPPAGDRALTLAAPFAPAEFGAALLSLVHGRGGSTPAEPPGKRALTLGERLPLRILAADDVRTNRDVVHLLCRHLGYEIDLVENGVEALQRLNTHVYDLILMDVQMPVLDGIAATREICRRYPDAGRRPRVVAVTASAQPGDREHGLAAGMDDYLVKPLLPRAIQGCIERLFEGRAAPAAPTLTALMASTAPTAPWVDCAHLKAVTEGLDAATALDLLVRFAAAVKEDYLALRPRLEELCAGGHQATELREVVHGLKGCVLSVGWARMGQRCAQILLALTEQQPLAWNELPAEFATLYQNSAREMDRVLAELFAPVPASV